MRKDSYLSAERLEELQAERYAWWLNFRYALMVAVGTVIILGQLTVLGFMLTKPKTPKQEVYASVRSGEVTPGVPCWAVYNYNGVLVARTALSNDMGVLREFNVLGGPINSEPLPEPWRWFELSAEFSKEEP